MRFKRYFVSVRHATSYPQTGIGFEERCTYGEFYRLIPDVQLRGWQKLPYALVHRVLGQVEFLNETVFRYISLLNGLCDISLNLAPQKVRDIASAYLKQG